MSEIGVEKELEKLRHERKLTERTELIIEMVKEIDINHIRLNRELDAKVALVMAEN